MDVKQLFPRRSGPKRLCRVCWVIALGLAMTIFIVITSIILTTHSSQGMIPSVNEYFPQLEGDLTKIEWEHATNSWSLLNAALANEAINMLEADIVLGHLNNGTDLIPVMGHPPATSSDLSLEQFISAVIDYQTKGKKGIKLDFKSDVVYNASWEVIDGLKDKFTFPVWLNADILPGPVNATAVPLNPENFLSLATKHLPEAALSLGWTTNFHLNGMYNQDQLDAMLTAIQKSEVTQPITLAVRAAFAANSEEGLIDLVSTIDKYQGSNSTTLTIWMSSATDILSIQSLRSLILNLGKNRSALDVPKKIKDLLDLENATPVTVAKRALGTLVTSVTTALKQMTSLW